MILKKRRLNSKISNNAIIYKDQTNIHQNKNISKLNKNLLMSKVHIIKIMKNRILTSNYFKISSSYANTAISNIKQIAAKLKYRLHS